MIATRLLIMEGLANQMQILPIPCK